MNTATIFAVIILALIVSLAVRYIVREKRRGAKCIGCPFAGSCEKHDPSQHAASGLGK